MNKQESLLFPKMENSHVDTLVLCSLKVHTESGGQEGAVHSTTVQIKHTKKKKPLMIS